MSKTSKEFSGILFDLQATIKSGLIITKQYSYNLKASSSLMTNTFKGKLISFAVLRKLLVSFLSLKNTSRVKFLLNLS